MDGTRRLVVLAALSLVACASQKPSPVAPTPVARPPSAEVAEEAPDLSPVSAPAGIFGKGRIVRPLALSDSVAGWAGLPVGLRELLPDNLRDLDAVIAWDAPVEFALVLGSGGRKSAVQAVVTLGLTSAEGAKKIAAERGYDVQRIAPGIFSVGGLSGASCAIAPALGPASTRFVCSTRKSELDDLLPYATRGLPNEKLGNHDLDFELAVEPVRQKFGTAIGSARLFAGFLVPRIALDAPRFDAAVSDASYAIADEFVALVDDLDMLRVEGSVKADKRELEFDVALRFRGKKSFTAHVLGDATARSGPTPAAFFRLPAESTGAGFSYGVVAERWTGVQKSLSELVDAYLEAEKVGRPGRDRAKSLIESAFAFGAAVNASAEGPADSGTAEEKLGWSLYRSDVAAAKQRGRVQDLHALLSDRGLRKAVARRLKVAEKVLPTVKLETLRGAGVPAGTRALSLSVSREFRTKVLETASLSSGPGDAPAALEMSLAIVPDGTGTIVAVAPTAKELGVRLGAYLAGKGPTLNERKELARFHELSATAARYTTLEGLIAGFSSTPETRRGVAGLRNHGRTPIIAEFDAETGPPLTGHLRFTLPAGVFEDLPGLASLLGSGLGGPLSKP